MLRKLLLLIVALSLPVGMAAPSMAAIIGPKLDWIPIEDATKPCPANPDPHLACGLSQEQVDSIMAAGMRFECPGADGGTLNAWALDDGTGDVGRVYTNAHAIVDEATETVVRRLPECRVMPYMKTHKTRAYIDVEQIYLGTTTPASSKTSLDRARIVINDTLAGLIPLSFDPRQAAKLRPDVKLYLISLLPSNMTIVSIQACYALRPPFYVKERSPAVMGTDCDAAPGTSAGLYVRPHFQSNGQVSSIEPVAIARGGVEKLGDYKDWDGKKNTSTAIVLDEKFNEALLHFVSPK